MPDCKSPDSEALLKSRRFLPFFLTQLSGAFNDNLFKNGLTIFIAYQAANVSQASSNNLVNIAAGLFILPFFLFSAIAGQLADKYDKAWLMRRIKLLEIAIMLLAGIAFFLQSIPMLIGILFLMGTQSAMFGPVKYSILPQALKQEELIGGNALVEAGTFLAILIGLIVSVFIINIEPYGLMWLALAVISVAIIGYLFSRKIPAAPSLAADLEIDFNLIRQTGKLIKLAYKNPTVFYSVLGISWFWFIGITYVTQLPNYVRYDIGGDEKVYILLLAMFSIGIGFGSFLCERMSGRMVEIGLVPIGALGLTIFGVDIYFARPEATAELITISQFIGSPSSFRIMIDIMLLGTSGGIYIVPLYALVQTRSEAAERSRIIAANNILNALFMVMAALYGLFALSAGAGIPDLFLMVAIMNAAIALFIFKLVPEFVMRLLVWLLIHTVYRVKKIDLEKIPDNSAAVLVCNHVSFVDALILIGSIRRPIRFVMYYKIFQLPVLSFIFKTANAIPIAGAKEKPKLMQQAFDEIHQALQNDELVCIFPEGKITDSGEMNAFKPGVLKILERDPVPTVPLALRGLWGSFFSRKYGSAMSRLFPRGWFSSIELVAGDAVNATDASCDNLSQKVKALRGEPK